MGEKAQAGYERAERATFAALPGTKRLLANLVAACIVAGLALIFATIFFGPLFAADIKGTVTHVVDGDTFDMKADGEPMRIRLCGIDAPERGMDGYAQASAKLKATIGGRSVRCVRIGEGTVCDGKSAKKNQGRVVAQCFVGSADIGSLMIRARLACDYQKHSGGYYQGVGVAGVCVR